jgi:hypothetical protein
MIFYLVDKRTRRIHKKLTFWRDSGNYLHFSSKNMIDKDEETQAITPYDFFNVPRGYELIM